MDQGMEDGQGERWRWKVWCIFRCVGIVVQVLGEWFDLLPTGLALSRLWPPVRRISMRRRGEGRGGGYDEEVEEDWECCSCEPSFVAQKGHDVNGGPLKSREVDKQPFMEPPHCQGLCSIKRSVCNTKSMFLWFLFFDSFCGVRRGLKRWVACFTSCSKTINVTNGWRCQMG